jgi:hypothetical protein
MNNVKDIKGIMFISQIQNELCNVKHKIHNDDIIMGIKIKINSLTILYYKSFNIYEIFKETDDKNKNICTIFQTDNLENFLETFRLIYDKKIIFGYRDNIKYEKDVCFVYKVNSHITIKCNDIYLTYNIKNNIYKK